MSQDRLNNEKYIDWVKLKLTLQYVKEGLEPVTEHKVHAFFNNLSSTLQTPSSSSAPAGQILCHACVKVDIKKQWSRQKFSCVGGICDRWLNSLQQEHVNPTSSVEWDNVDVSRLPISPWECAKLYLPYGSGHIKGAGNADLAAILTLYLNCRHFASSLQDLTLCEKVKDVRNNLLHSGTMEVDRARMLSDVGLVKQLLKDPAFAADQSCKGAIAKIDKLVQNKLELSLNKELELRVLNQDIKYVAGITDQLKQDMPGLATQVQQCGQLGTRVTGLDKDVTDLKDKLAIATNDIDQLQNIADLLCNFINNCQIDKVDMGQLASSISTLSTLRDETARHGQILVELQETVGRHDDTLEQHGQEIDQLKEQLRQQHKTDGTNQDGRGIHDITALQQYLLAVYKNDCKWENPTTGDEDKKVTISKMYVQPAMKMVRQRDDSGGLVQAQQRQGDKGSSSLSYRQIFYNGEELCTNIYITGDAGMGKTTFCKQLVYSWCKAVQNISEEGDSAEDLKLLKEFSVLFYVNLREAESKYHIVDMIRETVLYDAPTEYDVRDTLKTEKCLIVLDGLDEWSCPPGASFCRGLNKEIPGRNAMNKNCVYLTTTRNWKFDVIDLKSKDVDKHVELCGIGEKSAEDFAENVVRQLVSKSQSNRQIADFFREVEERNLDSLTIVPVLLTQLLTLWYFFKGLAKSQVQLYCKMFDLLLEQAKKHLPETTSTVTKPVQTDVELPECFTEEDNCCNHSQLLLCLSKLAFSSLLNKKKEESLVFKSSRLNVCGIDSSDIRLCLKCGIFTQSKVLSNPTGKFKKYSFLHKKLQEFLAAVYLVTSDHLDENLRQVRGYCDTLGTTLEMGQMFMFVCGMKAEVGNKLLDHLTYVVSDDARVQNYRKTVTHEPLVKHIQTFKMACVAEGASNGLIINARLQDYWIDYDTIFYYVNPTVEQDHTSVKSVYMNTEVCNTAHVADVLDHLRKVHTIEKLRLDDPDDYILDITDDSMLPDSGSMLATVINNNVNTLKALCLGCADIRQDVLFDAVLGCMPSLHVLRLGQYNGKCETKDELDKQDIKQRGKQVGGLTEEQQEKQIKKLEKQLDKLRKQMKKKVKRMTKQRQKQIKEQEKQQEKEQENEHQHNRQHEEKQQENKQGNEQQDNKQNNKPDNKQMNKQQNNKPDNKQENKQQDNKQENKQENKKQKNNQQNKQENKQQENNQQNKKENKQENKHQQNRQQVGNQQENEQDNKQKKQQQIENLQGDVMMLQMSVFWRFRNVHMTHDQIEQLLLSTTTLQQLHLQLDCTDCTDHEGKCMPGIDLSAYTQLQSLSLVEMYVSNLQAVAHSVKYVYLRCVLVEYTTLRLFIDALTQTPNKVEVELEAVGVLDNSGNHVDMEAYLRGCDKFTVRECNILTDEMSGDKTWYAVHFHKR